MRLTILDFFLLIDIIKHIWFIYTNEVYLGKTAEIFFKNILARPPLSLPTKIRNLLLLDSEIRAKDKRINPRTFGECRAPLFMITYAKIQNFKFL